jgi:hypothetical protein
LNLGSKGTIVVLVAVSNKGRNYYVTCRSSSRNISTITTEETTGITAAQEGEPIPDIDVKLAANHDQLRLTEDI